VIIHLWAIFSLFLICGRLGSLRPAVGRIGISIWGADLVKKVLLVVQGEGRGHLTQALTCQDILQSQGYQIVHVLIGTSRQRQIPDFFLTKISAPISCYRSPNYIRDKQDRAICLGKSILFGAWRIPLYLWELHRFQQIVRHVQPDLIINFYEVLAALYAVVCRPRVPMVAVGHQFLLLHPQFKPPTGNRMMLLLARFWTHLTALGAHKVLALSFYPLPPAKGGRLIVMPPLIRQEILQQTGQPAEDFVLVYLLNSGYCVDVLEWHRRSPQLRIKCFCDQPPESLQIPANGAVGFYPLQGDGFCRALAACRFLVATAGFETLCEAAYLQKPILVLPVGNHFDQEINAWDLAVNARFGTAVTISAVVDTLNHLPAPQEAKADFQEWVLQSRRLLLQQLQPLAQGNRISV